MANGDIPVTGSAQEGTGSQATFPIRANNFRCDDDDSPDHLRVRTQGKQLHIFVNNGASKIFNEDLEPGWRFEIRER